MRRATLLIVCLLSGVGCKAELGLFWDPPATPTPVSYAPQALSASPQGSAVQLQWEAVSEPEITAFRVYSSTSGLLTSVPYTTTQYNVSGLANCDTDSFYVTSTYTDENGLTQESPASPVVSAAIDTGPVQCDPAWTVTSGVQGFGEHVLPAGDTDVDGQADFYVASPVEGSVYLFETQGQPLPLTTPSDEFALVASFGASLATGTLPLGGGPHLVVGSPDASGVGTVRVFNSVGTLVASGNGTAAGEQFGAAVAVGDVDGDVSADVICSSAGTGEVHVAPSGDFMSLVTVGPMTAGYGTALASDDLDGDGLADIAVGDPVNDTLIVIPGAADITMSTPASVTGTASGELGSVIALGDINGDIQSIPELIVGAPSDSATGTVRTYDLDTSGMTPVLTAGPGLAGETSGDQFGAAVAFANDFDGDGYGDILVGAPARATTGTAYLYLGDPATPQMLWSQDGAVASGRFGAGLAAPGDVTGDGLPDLVIGAPDAGTAYLFRQLPVLQQELAVGVVPSLVGDVGVTASSTVTIQAPIGGTASTLTCTVDWGDGFGPSAFACSSGINTISKVYSTEGTYTVRVTVTDAYDRSVTAATTAVISSAGAAQLSSPGPG